MNKSAINQTKMYKCVLKHVSTRQHTLALSTHSISTFDIEGGHVCASSRSCDNSGALINWNDKWLISVFVYEAGLWLLNTNDVIWTNLSSMEYGQI